MLLLRYHLPSQAAWEELVDAAANTWLLVIRNKKGG